MVLLSQELSSTMPPAFGGAVSERLDSVERSSSCAAASMSESLENISLHDDGRTDTVDRNGIGALRTDSGAIEADSPSKFEEAAFNCDGNSGPASPTFSAIDPETRPVPTILSTPPPQFPQTTTSPKLSSSQMIFTEFQRSQALAHRRRAMATTPSITEYEADLTSKDREKQKRAIKDILRRKVRNDWVWEWPPTAEDTINGAPVVNDGDVADEESGMEDSDREEKWIERLEWESNDSVDDNPDIPTYTNPELDDPFSSSDDGSQYKSEAEKRKARRRRRELQEMEYNDGMKCFTHRRNAWTGARHVPRSSKLAKEAVAAAEESKRANNKEQKRNSVLSRITSRTSIPPKSPKSASGTASVPSTPTTSMHTAQDQSQPPSHVHPLTPKDTTDYINNWLLLIPTNLHLLPPSTPMRKNVTEKAYGHIYDKVVLQSQTPYCPINLATVVRSCVEGWKRDGEWPPKEEGMKRVPTGASIARAETRKSTGRENGKTEGEKSKGGLRNSLKRVLQKGKRSSGIGEGSEGAVVAGKAE